MGDVNENADLYREFPGLVVAEPLELEAKSGL
jgi:hypothetical protein